MLKKRIIPCLDIKNGRTVKGVNFVDLRDAGDPVALAAIYAETGADELVFLDISATEERRRTLADLVLRVAAQVNIPFTVGGGISSVEDVAILLQNGADKVSINSSAVKNPELINELSAKFGSQCITVAIDAKKINEEFNSRKDNYKIENAIGVVRMVKGNYESSRRMLQTALKGAKQAKDWATTGMILSNIGIIYHEMEETEKAIEANRKSLLFNAKSSSKDAPFADITTKINLADL